MSDQSYAIRVGAKEHVRLDRIPADQNGGLDRDHAEELAAHLGEEMGELHDLLFAAGTHSLLVVLQGRDTSGKDGLIRHILRFVNAQSCRVVPFKAPEPSELAHDFLWRIHQQAPARGSIALFNRSHYEDVLIVRVRQLVPEHVWSRRYEHINAFERCLMDAGTIIVKVMLHISKEEQAKRLLDREKDPRKAWKLAVADWRERELWDAYTEAYEEMLRRCSPEEAPWHVVPADHKWYRNLAVTDLLVRTLRPYRDGWMEHLRSIGEKASAELRAYREGRPAQ